MKKIIFQNEYFPGITLGYDVCLFPSQKASGGSSDFLIFRECDIFVQHFAPSDFDKKPSFRIRFYWFHLLSSIADEKITIISLKMKSFQN